MAHIHGVYDTDTHFIVDPVKKELTVAEGYEKVKVIQHDHNSERFTFEMPRYIEGHDMSTCNKTEVHYLNVDSQTKEESKGLYPVDDLQVSPENEDVVICSWLISHNATKFVGSLFFVLRLECNTDAVIDYALNTLIYEGIYVGKGIYNADAIATEYADVLEAWKQELINAGGGGSISDEQIAEAVSNYMEENPVQSGATEAQAKQIQENTTNISKLSEQNVDRGTSLWAILEKTAFAEQLTEAELTAFKTAWGIDVVTIPCTGITLSKTTLSFTDTTSQTLTATVEPSDTTDKVVWSSNNNTVATVTNGVVKPLSNGSTTITATCGSVSATCSVTVDIEEEEQVTLSSITATYTGGDVAVGTSVNSLTGITVTATYSDGSTSNVTDYTLSGTIADGTNTITVSYSGLTTTFTVKGVAESGGGEDTRTLLHNWNFTQGLVDSVGGVTATLSGATQDSEGLKLATATDYCSLGINVLKPNRTIEIDVVKTEKYANGNHFRFITVNNDRGFIYRSNTSWQLYNGTWTGDATHTDGDMFSGKTLAMKIDSSSNVTILCDNVVVAEQDFSNLIGESMKPAFAIGSSSASYYNATVSAVRIYEGVA